MQVLILARESGVCIEMDSIDVESLLPPDMANLSTDELVKRLPELNEEMSTLALAASEHVCLSQTMCTDLQMSDKCEALVWREAERQLDFMTLPPVSTYAPCALYSFVT